MRCFWHSACLGDRQVGKHGLICSQLVTALHRGSEDVCNQASLQHVVELVLKSKDNLSEG